MDLKCNVQGNLNACFTEYFERMSKCVKRNKYCSFIYGLCHFPVFKHLQCDPCQIHGNLFVLYILFQMIFQPNCNFIFYVSQAIFVLKSKKFQIHTYRSEWIDFTTAKLDLRRLDKIIITKTWIMRVI